MKHMNSPVTLMLLLILSACSSVGEMTGLSQSSNQNYSQSSPTHVQHFNTSKGLAFSSAVAALQEMGYEVTKAEYNIGMIKATSGSRNGYVPYVGSIVSETLVSAHVEQIGVNTTQIRLDLIDNRNVDDSYGASYKDNKPIKNPEVYNDMWARIAGAIDYRKQLQQQNGHRAIKSFFPRMITFLPTHEAAAVSS